MQPTWLHIALLLGGCLSPFHATAADNDGPPSSGTPTGPRLTITSDSTCPTGSAVAEALAALIPPVDWPGGTVRIQSMADVHVVELVSDESTRRQVRMTADCGLRATTVALVIATWTGELASDAAGAPVLRAHATSRPGEVPAKIPPVTTTALSVVPVSERELGAGLLLSSSGGLAPGGRIDFVQTRAPKGLGWQVGLALPARRERAAFDGTTSWTRAAASLAVNGRVTLRRFIVSADAGLAVTYTFTSGHGYTIHQSAEALTGGLAAGARLALPWQHMRVWTDLRAYKWLFPQALTVNSPEGDRLATVALPSSDFQWAMGLAYLFH